MSENIAYMAGLLEGEGALQIHRVKAKRKEWNPTYRPSMCISMTDREPVEWCATAWGRRISSYRASTKGGRLVYRAVCPTQVIRILLPQLTQHFKSARKRKEAELILRLARRTGTRSRDSKGRSVEMNLAELKYRHWLWEEMYRVKHLGGGTPV